MTHALSKITLLIVIVGFIGCDQATKHVARWELATSPSKSYFLSTVTLSYSENSGVFLGLGSTLPSSVRFLFHLLTGVLVIVGIIALVQYADGVDRITVAGSCLLLGGACGNLVDRLLNNGRVIDFIILGVGPIRTGVFNVADVLIISGAVLLVFSSHRWSKVSP